MEVQDITTNFLKDVLKIYNGIFAAKKRTPALKTVKTTIEKKNYYAIRNGTAKAWTSTFVIGRSANKKLNFGIIINTVKTDEKGTQDLLQKKGAFEANLYQYFKNKKIH